MRSPFRMLAGLAAVIAVGVNAAEESLQLQHNPSPAPVESPPGEAFRERFKVAFDERVDKVIIDRLHPFKVMNWSIELGNRDSNYLRERAASATRNALSRSLVYSAREAAIDLPIWLWLKERQGLLADFLRNSVGNVEEEGVAPLDLSYHLMERSWWERFSENGDVRFGIRPFRTSPYTFLSLGLKNADGLFLLGHLRYHYCDFADHRFEIALSLPLAHGLAIDLGTSYQFGHHGKEERIVVKLFKEFKSGGIVHVGLEARDRPAFLAGIAFPW